MPTEINTGQASIAQSAAKNQGIAKTNANDGRSGSKISEESRTKRAEKEPLSAQEIARDNSEGGDGSNVVISESGQKLQSLEQSIRQEPQVRIEVVREIQKRVENGDFPIDVENLARQIMDQESQF